MRAPKTPLPQWTPMPNPKEPNPFAQMIPGMYRGFLADGKVDAMMECAELVCDYMGIDGAAHIAEFAASNNFKKLAVEVLNNTDHPAKNPLSDHFLLLAASVAYGERSDTLAYKPTARVMAQQACDFVAKFPIIFEEHDHASD